ncbi:MAG: hypothetical protein ACRDGN_10555 [bacterium]
MKTWTSILMVLAGVALVAPSAMAATTLVRMYEGALVAPYTNTVGVSYNEHDYVSPANYFHLHVTDYTGPSPKLSVCPVRPSGYTDACWTARPDAMGWVSTRGVDHFVVTLQSGADVTYQFKLFKIS